MRIWRGLSVLFISLVLVSCATTDNRSRGGGWVLLGEREADFRIDRDRINVGRREGAFREIRIAVRGASLEMYNMVVTFGDGSTFSPNIRTRFEVNSWSRDLDLPGDRRVIRSVDFTYRSINRREGRATVTLYGR